MSSQNSSDQDAGGEKNNEEKKAKKTRKPRAPRDPAAAWKPTSSALKKMLADKFEVRRVSEGVGTYLARASVFLVDDIAKEILGNAKHYKNKTIDSDAVPDVTANVQAQFPTTPFIRELKKVIGKKKDKDGKKVRMQTAAAVKASNYFQQKLSEILQVGVNALKKSNKKTLQSAHFEDVQLMYPGMVKIKTSVLDKNMEAELTTPKVPAQAPAKVEKIKRKRKTKDSDSSGSGEEGKKSDKKSKTDAPANKDEKDDGVKAMDIEVAEQPSAEKEKEVKTPEKEKMEAPAPKAVIPETKPKGRGRKKKEAEGGPSQPGLASIQCIQEEKRKQSIKADLKDFAGRDIGGKFVNMVVSTFEQDRGKTRKDVLVAYRKTLEQLQGRIKSSDISRNNYQHLVMSLKGFMNASGGLGDVNDLPRTLARQHSRVAANFERPFDSRSDKTEIMPDAKRAVSPEPVLQNSDVDSDEDEEDSAATQSCDFALPNPNNVGRAYDPVPEEAPEEEILSDDDESVNEPSQR